MDISAKLKKLVNLILLPKLSRNIEEEENPRVFETRKNNLKQNFQHLHDLIEDKTLAENFRADLDTISLLIILYEELKRNSPWNNEYCKECSLKLNNAFHNTVGVTFDKIFYKNNILPVQDLFDSVMQYLHIKVTSEDFKKYPGLIEVYCSLLQDIKEYDVTIKPLTILPMSLILIDDYVNTNKIKGLMCCSSIFNCLNSSAFEIGNYYEVVYGSLIKVVMEKDVEITKLLLQCLLQFLHILPADIQSIKTDDAYAKILEQLYTESNLYRKAVLFDYIKIIIGLHGINTANRKILKTIFIDNVQICCDQAVSEILLKDVLECLEVWLKHCWCVWCLSSDYKLLSALFKLLYVCDKNGFESQTHNLIVTLIRLCTKDEQKMILQSFAKPDISNTNFLKKLETIKIDVSE